MIIYQAVDTGGEKGQVLIGIGLNRADVERLVTGQPIGISAARLTALARADFVCVHTGEDGAAVARSLAYTEERRHTDAKIFKQRGVILNTEEADADGP